MVLHEQKQNRMHQCVSIKGAKTLESLFFVLEINEYCSIRSGVCKLWLFSHSIVVLRLKKNKAFFILKSNFRAKTK